jgi:diaminopimelate epimerase
VRVPFTKMHGIGNDFIVVDGLVPGAPTPAQLQPHLISVGHRRFGVGFDQFLFVHPSNVADFAMPIFNPDGSEAEMCGNGIRAFAKYVFDHGYTNKTTLTVETLGGIKTLELQTERAKVSSVTVDMGEPGLDRTDIGMIGEVGPVLNEVLEVNHEPIKITGVSMGNPHVVFFADEATDATINAVGPVLENHPRFPRRTNVHLVEVLGPSELKILTWERGAGRTLACGTGACACLVAASLNGRTGRHALCHLPGGDLFIRWDEKNDHVYMTGPATEVFRGEIEL